MADKYKPVNGFTQLLHYGLVLIYPLALYALVRTNFIQLALILVVLSKWRMFAVRPRFWLANIRANAVDIIVGLAVLAFMTQTGSGLWQFTWAVAYALWLLVLKPGSSVLYNSVQSGVGLVVGLCALYLSWAAGPLYGLVLITGAVCYLSARHFFDSFDEANAKLLAALWGYFGAALMWLLGHWLLFYGMVAQPAVLLVTIGFGLGSLYYLNHFDRLTRLLRRQLLFAMVAIVLVVLVLSDWSSTIV